MIRLHAAALRHCSRIPRVATHSLSTTAAASAAHLPPPLLNCDLDVRSPNFQEAMERTNAQVEELNQFLESVRQGGCPEAVKRYLKRNKYLPRDRIQRLVDPGTPLLELSALAGCDAQSMRTDEPIPSGGIVTAIGVVSGKLCMLIANDATVKGGNIFPSPLRSI